MSTLGVLFFHLPFDEEHTDIGFLKLDDSTFKRATDGDIV
jgi:hypothetical protein